MLSIPKITKTWWPLAASWLLMGAELPAISAIVARLANPEVNLAAYGSIVFPLSMIIEAPIIMLLAASTALSKDWSSFAKLRKFMMAAGAALTALHLLLAFTPLFDLVVGGLISAPPETLEPARIGMMLMTPWTWSIAYRRFHQGVLIRFGRSQAVGVGTVVRLTADILVLGLGYWIGSLPGIVVATLAVSTGVVSEAAYVGWVVRPVLAGPLKAAPPVGQPITLRSFLDFYIPLAMTSLLSLIANPIGSAALSRMPDPLASMAVWPVVTGLIFMLRSLGIAFNEVVVALLDEPHSARNLHRFALILSAATTLALLIVTVTPFASFWFEKASALSPELAAMARLSMWLALPLPALNTFMSWYQGAILYGRRTRGITESVVIYLLTTAAVFGFGVIWGQVSGLYIGLIALTLSVFTQTVWLWYRSRAVLKDIQEQETREVSYLEVP